jgi:hypothetical protein
MPHIFNIYYPKAITIIELAQMAKTAITQQTKGEIQPKIEIIDTKQPVAFDEKDKEHIAVNISKAQELLGDMKLKSPKESIEEIVKIRTSREKGTTSYQHCLYWQPNPFSTKDKDMIPS